ncbi:MAG TPA: hypothetical protein VFP70_07825 [Burkholderiales bacterium]|nr:hypothetical protein [Burkholderiales bacterium]
MPLLAAIPSAPGASQEVQPGMWEITSTMEMPGMLKMAPQMMRHCFTKKDVEDNKKTVP